MISDDICLACCTSHVCAQVMSKSLQPYGLQPARLLEFPWQEYWSGLPFPSPGAFPNPGMNLDLLHCRLILYHLRHQGSPKEIHFYHFSGDTVAEYPVGETQREEDAEVVEGNVRDGAPSFLFSAG